MTRSAGPSHQLLIQLQQPSGSWIDVGTLNHFRGRNWFEFLDSYWQHPDRPVLGQEFEESGRKYQPRGTVSLPTWFSHLLHEGLLRRAVARAAGVNEKREYFLLEQVGGDDLPGAVRAVPLSPSSSDPTRPPNAAGRDEAPLTNELKFSLAGAQVKFSLADETHEKGLTLPVSGEAGKWIAKLPDRREGFSRVPELEHAILLLASDCGFDVPEIRLFDPNSVEGLPEWARRPGDVALAIRRFDRLANGQRCHFEELAQILRISTGSDTAKYDSTNFETLTRTIGALCGPASAIEVFRRIVFNALVGNGDAHLKNWGVRYPDGKSPDLCPIYDVLPTVIYIENDHLGLNFCKSKLFRDIDRRSIERFGRRTETSPQELLEANREIVAIVNENWNNLRDHLSAKEFDKLTEHRDSLLLLGA